MPALAQTATPANDQVERLEGEIRTIQKHYDAEIRNIQKRREAEIRNL